MQVFSLKLTGMKTSEFSLFIAEITSRFTSVLDVSYSQQDYIAIDLSEANEDLEKINISSSEAFTGFIEDYLEKYGKKVAFGGYREVRKLYRRSELFQSAEDAREVHLGVDFWAPANTAVLAVLDGKIHSFKDNANFGDYGPTIILEHEWNGSLFYSLYGHLNRRSLDNIYQGQEVKQGEKIAELGTPEENGDYAPHLHFQIIKELKDKKGDFPGVASRKELDIYLQNCPDPDLLLKLNFR